MEYSVKIHWFCFGQWDLDVSQLREVLFLWTRPCIQTHNCSMLYLFHLSIKDILEIGYFLLEADCMFLNNVKVVLYIEIQMLIGQWWQKCYLYRPFLIFHLVLLKNNRFEFFCRGLKWRCCTLRWLSAMVNNLLFCSLGWILNGPKTRKGSIDFHIWSIFKPKVLKHYRLEIFWRNFRRIYLVKIGFLLKLIWCMYD